MKQAPFSNAGVAQVQARILSLPLPDRIAETDQIQFSSPPSPLNQTPDGEIKVGKFVRH